MSRAATDCRFHEVHELRLDTHESKIETAEKERIRLRVKDKEIEQQLNKWKWIFVGFATCFSVITTGTSVLLATGWWLLSHQSVAKAVINASAGGQ